MRRLLVISLASLLGILHLGLTVWACLGDVTSDVRAFIGLVLVLVPGVTLVMGAHDLWRHKLAGSGRILFGALFSVVLMTIALTRTLWAGWRNGWNAGVFEQLGVTAGVLLAGVILVVLNAGILRKARNP